MCKPGGEEGDFCGAVFEAEGGMYLRQKPRHHPEQAAAALALPFSFSVNVREKTGGIAVAAFFAHLDLGDATRVAKMRVTIPRAAVETPQYNRKARSARCGSEGYEPD